MKGVFGKLNEGCGLKTWSSLGAQHGFSELGASAQTHRRKCANTRACKTQRGNSTNVLFVLVAACQVCALHEWCCPPSSHRCVLQHPGYNITIRKISRITAGKYVKRRNISALVPELAAFRTSKSLPLRQSPIYIYHGFLNYLQNMMRKNIDPCFSSLVHHWEAYQKLLLLVYVACTLLHWWAPISIVDTAPLLPALSVMNDTHWSGQPHGFPVEDQSKEHETATECHNATPFRRAYTIGRQPVLPTLLTTIP